MTSTDLPPCGLYKTTVAIAEVPAGRLVSFHNHGTPGPGVYLPEGWSNNLARFSKRGITLPDLALAASLSPLPVEGFYVVTEPFTCCAQLCRTYAIHALVQLGYNAAGDAILFSPSLGPTGVLLPTRGVKIDDEHFAKLQALVVDAPVTAPASVPPGVVH